MRSHFLRRFRIFFSAIIFICFFFVFSDIRNLIPAEYINYLLFLQFVPSFIKFYDLGTLASAGFLIVILLTLISGRTYCSFLCPLGIGQDILSRIGGKVKKRFRRYGFKRPFTILRYALLAASIIVLLVWGMYLVTLLDPYSIFGRFMTYFAKPGVIIINNVIAGIMGKFDIYTLTHQKIILFLPYAYVVPAAFFILVGTLSFTKGRLYCNMICPVGTLLGLLSKISIYSVFFPGKTGS